MIDQWNEQLRCRKCRNTGMASPSQGEDDQTPTVLKVPLGFKAVETEFGPDFQCVVCGVRADP